MAASVESNHVKPNLLFILHYLFKALALSIGGVAIYLGYRLFILGVTGQASISIESKTISGQLLNGAPGLFFAVGGIVIVVFAICRGVSTSITPCKDGTAL